MTATSAGGALSIRIQPYTEEWIEAVGDFNRRVRPAHVPFQLPDTPSPSWLPRSQGREVYQEVFLAIEKGRVHGGYTFKHQKFVARGQILDVGMCRMPISEGIVDKRYALVAAMLMNDAIRRQPLLYALGIGSLEAAMTRLLLAMGWKLNRVVPFFFKVRNGFQFLKEIRHLRATWARRILLDAAAYSGMGWAGASVMGRLLTRKRLKTAGAEQVSEYSGWADEVWQDCESRYSLLGVRDAKNLNALYPAEDARFVRLRVMERQRPIGWAVLLDTEMSENKYFGNMRVGSLIDCLAAPEDADRVVAAAAGMMEQRGVDLMLSNQSHPAWRRALRVAGFVEGPSNFYFVTSPELTKLLNDIDPYGAGIHLNRGDGDGPIHL